MWMKRPALQRAFGRSRPLRRLSIGALARLELLLLRGHKDRATLDVIRRARREKESLLTGNEAFLLYSLARTQSALGGDMAEVGVYEGASARLICEAKGDRVLHLFDTFTGLPEPSPEEARVLERHQFAASLEEVRAFLAPYPGVLYHAGAFPQSAAAVGRERFSLVHLDVDLRSSTLECLRFFYPRLVRGGVIVSHDYSILDGVRSAFDEFLSAEPARLLELPTTQALVIRT